MHMIQTHEYLTHNYNLVLKFQSELIILPCSWSLSHPSSRIQNKLEFLCLKIQVISCHTLGNTPVQYPFWLNIICYLITHLNAFSATCHIFAVIRIKMLSLCLIIKKIAHTCIRICIHPCKIKLILLET